MEKITLPLVQIEHKNGRIVITHKTGMRTSATPNQLERWAVRFLREELAPSKGVAS